LDYVANARIVAVDGSLWGSESVVTDCLNQTGGNPIDLLYVALGITGSSVKSTRSVDREYIPGAGAIPGLTTKLDFSDSFDSTLSAADRILKCEVNEKISFSGNRNVVIDIPYDVSVVQNLGTTPARRTVNGSVVATNETTAVRYAKTQKSLAWPTADGAGGIPSVPTTTYNEPPELTINHGFVDLTSGVVRGQGKNTRVVTVQFTFEEIVPNYPYA
jgi:hypothetical protein